MSQKRESWWTNTIRNIIHWPISDWSWRSKAMLKMPLYFGSLCESYADQASYILDTFDIYSMKLMSTRSDPKVPGLIVVFKCALNFPKHVYAMRSSDILATHSLKSFLSRSFNLEILHRTWDHVGGNHRISSKWRPLMNNMSALTSA